MWKWTAMASRAVCICMRASARPIGRHWAWRWPTCRRARWPADPDPQIGSPYQWRRDDYVRVRYAAAERLPQVSYADVLDGHVDTAMLHGRIVVGMTASGIAPRLLTPTSTG